MKTQPEKNLDAADPTQSDTSAPITTRAGGSTQTNQQPAPADRDGPGTEGVPSAAILALGMTGLTPVPPGGLIDLAAMRVSQDHLAEIDFEEVLGEIAVRKPNAQEWVRSYGALGYSITTQAVFVAAEMGKAYLVARGLWEALADHLKVVRIVLFVNRQGVFFLWATKLPGPDGRVEKWHRAPMEAETRARTAWVQYAWNALTLAHVVRVGKANLSDPPPPPASFDEVLQRGFRDQYIDSLDHPVARALLGEE